MDENKKDSNQTLNGTIQLKPAVKEAENESETKKIIKLVCAALIEKGYNPINQIVGYILSGDPTYITSYNNARSLIRRFERDELLEELVKSYLSNGKI